MKTVAMAHLQGVFDIEKRKIVVNQIASLLRQKKWQTDFFVGRGISGTALASILAYKFKKGLCVVRKPEEKNHSWNKVEGFGCNDCNTFRYIIVDDLIASGDTMNAIHNALILANDRDGHNHILECTGIILYSTSNEASEYESKYPWAKNIFTFNVHELHEAIIA